MNSEIMDEREVSLNILYIKKADNKYNEYSVNGEIILLRKYQFEKLIEHYEYISEMMYLFGETLLSISNNNKLLLHIQTKEGYMYETSIGFYEKIIETRLKIFEVANRNNDIILSTYTPKNSKILIDHNCGHDYHEVNGFNYINYETSCPVCLHKKIVPYVNDCYTLRPDLLKYFKNVNDAIGLAVNDNNKRTYVCPDCGSVRKNTLSNILDFLVLFVAMGLVIPKRLCLIY